LYKVDNNGLNYYTDRAFNPIGVTIEAA